MVGSLATARAETFDVATFPALSSAWTRQATQASVAYTRVDPKAKTFCRLAMYASTPGSGNPRADFDAEWRSLITQQVKSTTAPVIREPAEMDGWMVTTGGAKLAWDGRELTALLVVASTATQKFSLAYLATGDCKAELTPVLSTLKLRSARAGAWTVSAQQDLVELRRGEIVARLHYATPIPDNLRADAYAKRDHFWATLVAPRYQRITNVVKPRIAYDNEMVEADAVDTATRRSVHVAVHLFTSNGVVSAVEVSAPSKAALDAAFPDATKIDALRSLNRFALSPADLAGTWSDSSGAFLDYYNVYTGDFSGVHVSSSSYTVTFRANWTFTSVVKAVTGRIGSLQFGKEHQWGTWTLSADGHTLTANSKTYDIWFEAVRGGRVLHIVDRLKPGMHDVLSRQK